MQRIEDLPKDFANRLLDRMGTNGQPPERGARFVNVGTDAILELLRDEYLRPIKASGRNSAFKLVQATFGGGKTHFLHCMRELAWSEGFATSLVGLSPKECPFDQPTKIYQAVAARLEYPVAELEQEPHAGVRVVLRQIAQRRIEENGKDEFADWLREEFAERPIESATVHRAVRLFLQAVVDGDLDAVEVLGDVLLGENVPAEETSPYRLREALSDDVAFRWLRSLAQCLTALGMPGTVLMFDEMDRNMSLGVRRRREIGDNLRQMIDYCGQSHLPGVLWLYAVPPEFFTTIVPEYPALAQRLKRAAQFSALSPLEPIIDLEHLALAPEELLFQIGGKLLELEQHVHGGTLDQELQRTNLRTLAKSFAAKALESGVRREFVKAAVGLLERQRRGGEGAVKESELQGSLPIEPVLPGEAEF